MGEIIVAIKAEPNVVAVIDKALNRRWVRACPIGVNGFADAAIKSIVVIRFIGLIAVVS
jgi:hypothetical protein